MKHKRQMQRCIRVRMIQDIDRIDLPKVIKELEHILTNKETTFHSYHNPRIAIQPAVSIYEKHNIIEGVNHITDLVLSGSGKGSFMMSTLLKSLPKYGAHAKPVIPKLMENHKIKTMYLQGDSSRFLKSFKKMISVKDLIK